MNDLKKKANKIFNSLPLYFPLINSPIQHMINILTKIERIKSCNININLIEIERHYITD